MTDDWKLYIKTKDREVRNRIAVRYAPIVLKIATRLKRKFTSPVCLDDLVGNGYIGLLEAIDRYNPEKCKFETFAFHRIHGAMIDGIRAMDPIPRLDRDRFKMIGKTKRKLLGSLGELPTDAQVANDLDRPEDRVTTVLRKMYQFHRPSNLNEVVEGWGEPLYLNIQGPSKDPVKTVHDITVAEVICRWLSVRDATMVHLYYFIGHTM